MADPETHYQAQIQVAAPPDASFDAVATGMDKWWTTTTTGGLTAVGDRVTARFPPDYGFWTFEAATLEPGRRLEMICVEAHHKVEGQPKEIDQEWLGTRIVWAFDPAGEKTRITMTHEGLTPTLNCWDICLDGWNHFFKSSLKAYLDGGEPSPHAPQ